MLWLSQNGVVYSSECSFPIQVGKTAAFPFKSNVNMFSIEDKTVLCTSQDSGSSTKRKRAMEDYVRAQLPQHMCIYIFNKILRFDRF